MSASLCKKRGADGRMLFYIEVDGERERIARDDLWEDEENIPWCDEEEPRVRSPIPAMRAYDPVIRDRTRNDAFRHIGRRKEDWRTICDRPGDDLTSDEFSDLVVSSKYAGLPIFDERGKPLKKRQACAALRQELQKYEAENRNYNNTRCRNRRTLGVINPESTEMLFNFAGEVTVDSDYIARDMPSKDINEVHPDCLIEDDGYCFDVSELERDQMDPYRRVNVYKYNDEYGYPLMREDFERDLDRKLQSCDEVKFRKQVLAYKHSGKSEREEEAYHTDEETFLGSDVDEEEFGEEEDEMDYIRQQRLRRFQ